MINRIVHLYFNGSVFTKSVAERLYAQARWCYKLHRGNLPTPSLWEIIKYNLPFLKTTPPAMCCFLIRLINFLSESQRLLKVTRSMWSPQALH